MRADDGRVGVATYSLEEATALIRGADENGDPLPGQLQWVAIKLRNGQFPGYKSGRKWRMTEEHVREAIKSLEPQRPSMPDIPNLAGLTPTSRRRLAG